MTSFGGNVPPKPLKKGREYAFSSQTSIILKLTYLGRVSSDFDQKLGTLMQFELLDRSDR